MSDHTESNDSSPYAPPPIIADKSPTVLGLKPIYRFPLRITVAYSIGSTIATLAVPILNNFIENGLGNRWLSDWFGVLVFVVPLFSIAGFVGLYFFVKASEISLASSSLMWRMLMIVLVPPASMIVFVPTCLGTGIFIVPTIGMGSMYAIAIPLFIAFMVTCSVVATRLRNRLAQRDAGVTAPYSEIEPSMPANPLSNRLNE